MSNSTDLATVSPIYGIPDLQVMARSVAQSRLFPGIENEQAALCLMLLCQSEGLHPMQALRRYHIIEGRPSMRADAMQAEFQRRGGIVRWGRSDAEFCEADFVHPVQAPEPGVHVAISLQSLVESGVAVAWDKDKRDYVLKKNYRQNPESMLCARVISRGVRKVLPGVVVGIYTPEEAEDLREAEDRPRAVEGRPAKSLPGPSSIHVEQPGPELDSRSAVNAAFRGGTKSGEDETDEPVKDARSKETTPLWGDRIGPRGLDVRKWADVQEQCVAAIRARLRRHRVDELGLAPLEEKDELSQFAMLNHMVSATVAANAEDPNPNPRDEMTGKRKGIGNGKKAEHLHKLYLTESWREWMRAEAREWLSGKLAEGKAVAWTEFSGESATADAEAGSEPVAVVADGQTAGDEGWSAGRE